MNEIQIFTSPEFGEIRTLETNDGKILFCGKDAASALGYRDTVNALKMHCREDGVVFHHLIDSMGRMQKAKFISEGNLYRLIVHSQLSTADRFERWIFDEVLPTIRRTGGYVNDEELFLSTYMPYADDATKCLFRMSLQQIRRLNEKIEHDRPLVDFANHVAETSGLIDMNTMAKLAEKESIKIGRNRLFAWLRRKGVLMSNNLPYQKYIDAGYFQVKEPPSATMPFPFRQTFVTGKGQIYLIRRLRAEYQEE